MSNLKYLAIIVLTCFIPFSIVLADSSQYEKKLFEGTNLDSHWVIFSKPPFKLEKNKIVSVKATTSREALLSMVPKELTVNEENEIIFYVGKLNIVGDYPFSYNEGGIVIPVAYKKGTDEEVNGYFVPILYLSEVGPLLGGREVYGYNKHFAEIKLIEGDGQVRGTVTQRGATLIDITVDTNSKKVTNSIKIEHGGHFVIKRVPSAAYDGTFEVNQLNRVEVLDYIVDDYIKGDGKVLLGGTDWDPLNRIPIEEIKEAYYSTESNILGVGETIHDYLQ